MISYSPSLITLPLPPTPLPPITPPLPHSPRQSPHSHGPSTQRSLYSEQRGGKLAFHLGQTNSKVLLCWGHHNIMVCMETADRRLAKQWADVIARGLLRSEWYWDTRKRPRQTGHSCRTDEAWSGQDSGINGSMSRTFYVALITIVCHVSNPA